MKTRVGPPRGAICVALLCAALSAPSFAHEGRDQEPAPAAQAPQSTAGVSAVNAGAPRFSASSDLFELVGALDGQRLTLWLDRYADNAPVTGAAIELEVGEQKAVARPEGDRYLAELPAAPAPGRLPVTATVLAGEESDLLVAELVVLPDPVQAGAAVAASVGPGQPGYVLARDWPLAGALIGSALVAGAIGWTVGRRRRA